MKKRGRGRPPGTTKLPAEYWRDLVDLRGSRSGGFSRLSRNITDNGGMKWIDRLTGRMVAKITNKETLDTRISEAPRKVKEQEATKLAMTASFQLTTTTLLRISRVVEWAMIASDSMVSTSTGWLRTVLQIGKRKKYHN